MARLARKQLLLAKTEVTYGTDAAPGSVDTIQTSDLQFTPLAGPVTARNLNRYALGADAQVQVGQYCQVQFMVEFSGAGGAVDAVPAWGTLLGACGFDETVNAGVSVVYTPVSENFDSMTIYFYDDGQLHAMTGARGTVSMVLGAGGIPHFRFSFIGLYVAPSVAAAPTPDYTAFTPAIPVNNANMPTFSLHGQTVTMVDCNLDVGMDVRYRNVVGSESVQLVDRASAGNVVIEEPLVNVYDWYTAARTNVEAALQVVHGTTAGNIVTVDAARAQISSPAKGDSDGIRTLQMNLSLIPSSAGNDEITITTT